MTSTDNARRHKPGSEVTTHGFWNYAADNPNAITLYYRHCIVIGMGAKQASLYDVGASRNLMHRIYAAEYGRVTAGHRVDIDAIAALVDAEAAHLEAKVAWALERGTACAYPPETIERWRVAAEALRAGRYRVEAHSDLVAAIHANVRAAS